MSPIIVTTLSFIKVFTLGCLPFAAVTMYANLPEISPLPPTSQSSADWLVDGSSFKAGLYKGDSDNQLVLDNGLVRRIFQVTPEVATVALDNLTSGENHVRSIKPEALFTLNGTDYTVGGLTGQPVHNYLRQEWLPKLKGTIPLTQQLLKPSTPYPFFVKKFLKV
ncbi:MAG: hypothetical protein LBV12_01195 [Puniceicoccales bacterium]|nr:hypothetical protein [Puniceicoccales bacterium]